MNKLLVFVLTAALGITSAGAQDEHPSTIRTIFQGPGSVGGYGAVTSRFTTIGGHYAHLAGGCGGVYLNHRFFLGLGGLGTTNNIPVPDQFSVQPGSPMSYEYGQFGVVSEYAVASNSAVHVNFSMFAGSGFTFQYRRDLWDYDYEPGTLDENWFLVAEPGVQVEINLFRWMRISPGITYRFASGSTAPGLSDSDLSNISYSMTLKFGRF